MNRRFVTSDIINDISKLYPSSNRSLEFEVRFKGYGTKYGVSLRSFNRVVNYFSENYSSINSFTEDHISDSIRLTYTLSDSDRYIESWSTKTRLLVRDNPNYLIRFAVSEELDINPVDNFNPTSIREKDRKSFYLYDNKIRLDLT